MPVVANTQNAAVVAANTVMSRAFFPRAKQWLYKELAGSYTSVRLVEPFSLIGTVPPLERFNGFLKAVGVPSFSMNVPNPLWKNVLKVDQTDYEGDQTGTLVQLSQQIGVRLAEFPDQLFAKRLLSASTAGSQTMTFRGTSYTMTFDGQPLFSASHDDWYAGSTQSNIIQGELPATKALLMDDDYATNANKMLRDIQRVIDAVKTVKDNQGIPFFPTIDTKQSIVVVVPPILEPLAALAFRTDKTAVINQTTNVAPMFVKNVLTNGYLAGLRDPEDGTTLTPVNETDYYIFVVNDWVKPFYVQLFRPPHGDELFPPGYNAGAEVDRMLKDQADLDVDMATLYASARVDTTFRRVGAEADAYTIENENFIMSARYRGNIVYGPWFLSWRIKPDGGS